LNHKFCVDSIGQIAVNLTVLSASNKPTSYLNSQRNPRETCQRD
jgi:hypothetical protein